MSESRDATDKKHEPVPLVLKDPSTPAQPVKPLFPGMPANAGKVPDAVDIKPPAKLSVPDLSVPDLGSVTIAHGNVSNVPHPPAGAVSPLPTYESRSAVGVSSLSNVNSPTAGTGAGTADGDASTDTDAGVDPGDGNGSLRDITPLAGTTGTVLNTSPFAGLGMNPLGSTSPFADAPKARSTAGPMGGTAMSGTVASGTAPAMSDMRTMPKSNDWPGNTGMPVDGNAGADVSVNVDDGGGGNGGRVDAGAGFGTGRRVDSGISDDDDVSIVSITVDDADGVDSGVDGISGVAGFDGNGNIDTFGTIDNGNDDIDSFGTIDNSNGIGNADVVDVAGGSTGFGESYGSNGIAGSGVFGGANKSHSLNVSFYNPNESGSSGEYGDSADYVDSHVISDTDFAEPAGFNAGSDIAADMGSGVYANSDAASDEGSADYASFDMGSTERAGSAKRISSVTDSKVGSAEHVDSDTDSVEHTDADAGSDDSTDEVPPSIPLAPAKTLQAKFNPLADVMIYVVVFVGGFIGTALRFGLSLLLPSDDGGGVTSSFHIATFVANMVACFVYAMLTTYLSQASWLRKRVRQLTSRGVGMGMCGGLSTMSTLAIEEFESLQNGDIVGFVVYTVVTFLAGFVVAWVGTRLALAASAKRGAEVIVEAFAQMQKQQQSASASTSAVVPVPATPSSIVPIDSQGSAVLTTASAAPQSAVDSTSAAITNAGMPQEAETNSSTVPAASIENSETSGTPSVAGTAGAAGAAQVQQVQSADTGTTTPTVASLGIAIGPAPLGQSDDDASPVVATPGAIALPKDGAPPIIQPTVPLPAAWRRYEEPKPVTAEIPVVPDPTTGEVH